MTAKFNFVSSRAMALKQKRVKCFHQVKKDSGTWESCLPVMVN